MLRGNLAPRGAVIKQSAATPALLRTPAAPWCSIRSRTWRAHRRPISTSRADDVLVLRNAGPRGAPGMPEAGYIPIPKKLARQGVKDMVRISDARMSGTAFGTIVLHITPEAARRRSARAGADGDGIRLDVAGRRSTCWSTTPSSRAGGRRRRARRAGAAPAPTRGYAALFHRSVLQADEGCDFDFLVPGRGRRDDVLALDRAA